MIVNSTGRNSNPKVKKSILFALFIAVVWIGTASAQVQVAISPSKDNTLYEDASGALSNGSGPGLFFGRTGPGSGQAIRRALLAFDISGNVPAGATITSVSLTINVSRTFSGPQDVELHKVLADWGEGSSQASGQGGGGASAASGDATWIHRFFDTDSWSNAGGDFSTVASGSQSMGPVAAYSWSSTPQMVADVQDWLDNPAGNFGWLVMGDESAGSTAKRFDSREAATPPALTVEFLLSGDNNPPDLAAITDQSMDEGTILRIDLLASDPDADPITLSANNLPAFGSITDNGDGTGQLTFATLFADAGVYPGIEIIATDNGGLSDVETLTLTVNDFPIPNVAPELDPIADQVMDESTTLSVTIVATDADGDAIALSSPNLPSFGVLNDNGDGTGSIAFTPATADAGDHAGIEIVATDVFGFSDTERFTLTVNVDVGKVRYGVLCERCHGDPWNGPAVDAALVAGRRVTGARVCSIERAAFGVPGDPVFPNGVPLMSHLLGEITQEDIIAISDFLNSGQVTGEARFITTCSACHGKDATGGRVDEDVQGHEGDKIRDAIEDVDPMGFMECLTFSDTQIIGNYLEDLKDRFDDDDYEFLNSIGNITVREGDVFETTFVADAPAGQNISLAVIGPPSFMTFTDNGDGSGTATIAPTFDDAGVFRDLEVLAVTDGSPAMYDIEFFTLRIIDVPLPTSVEGGAEVIADFALEQNYPNPFNPETEIRFQVAEARQVSIRIFNTLGQEVRTLISRQLQRGSHRITWDGKDNSGKDVSSGMYLYQLRAGAFSQVRKMGLLR